MRQIAPRSVLYRCDRKPLAETIVHSNGAVYTSLIDLTLYLLYEVRGFFFVLLDPPAKIQLKLVVGVYIEAKLTPGRRDHPSTPCAIRRFEQD